MRRHRRATPADSGSLTLMLAVMMVVLLCFAGLAIDGGRKLAESQNAYSVAEEAARAGAGMVNTTTAYGSGRYQVSEPEALAAARAYLAKAGYGGTVTSTGNRIRVTVTVTEHTTVLSLIGIDTLTSKGTAVASLETGVTGPGA
jgi:Flp pilus assembly protein TadG